MKQYTSIIMYIVSTLSLLGSCDKVHEFPEIPDRVPLCLRLNFQTDLPQWIYNYDLGTSEGEVADSTENILPYGEMRYIVRTYPLTNNQQPSSDYEQEFIITRNIANGYDAMFTWDIIPGNYAIMVWSDVSEQIGEAPLFYTTTNFSEIEIKKHNANTDYRDAFRGKKSHTIISDIYEHKIDTLTIDMQRPLAKYEFITTDLQEFMDKELKSAISKGEIDKDEVPTKGIQVEDYKVVFFYPGFMPDTYSLFTDRAIDSATGIKFDSKITRLNEKEASLGFDYIFMGEGDGVVTVQIGIYNKNGEQLSLSEMIDVPLKHSKHTLMKGAFLMQETTGGVTINPEFEGEFNVVIP